MHYAPRGEALCFPAPAKVNLCLAVGYPPHDGYHPVESVFFELPLADDLELCLGAVGEGEELALTTAGTAVLLDCGALDVAARDNLVFKAVDGFERVLGRPLAGPGQALRIRVDKRIPAGGGLGGGSSDAASALKACCALAGLGPGEQRVQALARSLGADVAFFLQGGTAMMTGHAFIDLYYETYEESVDNAVIPVTVYVLDDETAAKYQETNDAILEADTTVGR